MKVSVRLFAGLRERAGAQRVEVELPDGRGRERPAGAMATTAVGALAPGQCVVAVNREYAAAGAPLREDDEVALVPPVSGGSGAVRRVRVTAEALDVAALSGAVRDPRAGAVVCFEGVTREVPELEYEAYAEMAVERLRAIGEEEAARHGLCAVALEHRTGTVALGEPSVIVAASAPHRGAAFAGARALIDRVKAEAPIWKRRSPRTGSAASRGGCHRFDRGRLPMQCLGRWRSDLTLGEAARALGVSADTLRRWDRAGKLRTVRDARNRRLVPARRGRAARARIRAATAPATRCRPATASRAWCARSRSTA